MTRRPYRNDQIDIEPITEEDERGMSLSYLEDELRSVASYQRERAACEKDDPKLALLRLAAADRLEELVDSVDNVSVEALADYAKALRFEREGPAYVERMHCSMTEQIGFTFHPRTIDDLCRLYVSAVECFGHFNRKGSMNDFWDEFLTTAHPCARLN